MYYAVEGDLQIFHWQDDFNLFKKLKAQPQKISDAIKALNKRKKSGAKNST